LGEVYSPGGGGRKNTHVGVFWVAGSPFFFFFGRLGNGFRYLGGARGFRNPQWSQGGLNLGGFAANLDPMGEQMGLGGRKGGTIYIPGPGGGSVFLPLPFCSAKKKNYSSWITPGGNTGGGGESWWKKKTNPESSLRFKHNPKGFPGGAQKKKPTSSPVSRWEVGFKGGGGGLKIFGIGTDFGGISLANPRTGKKKNLQTAFHPIPKRKRKQQPHHQSLPFGGGGGAFLGPKSDFFRAHGGKV